MHLSLFASRDREWHSHSSDAKNVFHIIIYSTRVLIGECRGEQNFFEEKEL
jgi:hypothetical protein